MKKYVVVSDANPHLTREAQRIWGENVLITSHAEAKSCIDQLRPDIVVYESKDELQKRELFSLCQNKEAYVLMCTKTGSSTLINEALTHGVNDIAFLPCDSRVLRRKLQNAMLG